MPFIDEQNTQTARDSLGGLTHVVLSFIALRLLTAPELTGTALAIYGVTFQDGLGGVFVWNSTDTTADNGSTVIRPWSVPLASAGRWNLWVAPGGSGGGTPVSPGAGVLGVVDSVPLVAAKTVVWELQAVKGTTTYSSRINASNDGTTAQWVEGFSTLAPAAGTFDYIIDVDVSGGNMRLTATPTSSGWTFSSKRIAQIAP